MVFIRCDYLPAMRTGLYATPNPAAMMPAAVLMKPPMSCEPKLMNPSPMTEATSVTTEMMVRTVSLNTGVYGVAVWSGILGVPVSVVSSSWVSDVLSVMFARIAMFAR